VKAGFFHANSTPWLAFALKFPLPLKEHTMKLLPDLWIAHPAADSMPVGLGRYLTWRWAEFLYRIICTLSRHHDRVEHRALYPERPYPDDYIPF
jgi:hypothetical protein